jgi:hypothetical protein
VTRPAARFGASVVADRRGTQNPALAPGQSTQTKGDQMAKTNYTLLLEGIEPGRGDRTIVLESWKMGVTNAVSIAETGRLSGGKSQHQDVFLTTRDPRFLKDKFLWQANDVHVKKATLAGVGTEDATDRRPRFKYVFRECLLTSHSAGRSGDAKDAFGQFTLAFANVDSWQGVIPPEHETVQPRDRAALHTLRMNQQGMIAMRKSGGDADYAGKQFVRYG